MLFSAVVTIKSQLRAGHGLQHHNNTSAGLQRKSSATCVQVSMERAESVPVGPQTFLFSCEFFFRRARERRERESYREAGEIFFFCLFVFPSPNPLRFGSFISRS